MAPFLGSPEKKKSVSTSTAEAEYVVLSEASKQSIWVSRMLKELHVADQFLYKGGMLIYTDNQSAMAIAKGTNSSKTKHIDVAYHFVCEKVNSGEVSISYIPTGKMIADILTKPLLAPKARPLCAEIFNSN